MAPESTLRGSESDAEIGPVLSVDLSPVECQALLQALARSVRDLETEKALPPYRTEEEIVDDVVVAWALIDRLSIPVRDWPERNLPGILDPGRGIV
jgi:hypothetical protein